MIMKTFKLNNTSEYFLSHDNEKITILYIYIRIYVLEYIIYKYTLIYLYYNTYIRIILPKFFEVFSKQWQWVCTNPFEFLPSPPCNQR